MSKLAAFALHTFGLSGSNHF